MLDIPLQTLKSVVDSRLKPSHYICISDATIDPYQMRIVKGQTGDEASTWAQEHCPHYCGLAVHYQRGRIDPTHLGYLFKPDTPGSEITMFILKYA
jgi:hypothetical protein